MRLAKEFRVSFIAVSEWAMILPATIFLGAAALRQLQPRQYEPAHLSWLVFSWTMAHISRWGAAVVFIGLPLLAALAGCAVLLRAFYGNEKFREDVIGAFRALGDHAAMALIAAATLAGGAIFVLACLHVLTD